MINAAFEQALNSLLAFAGKDVQFIPKTGDPFPLRVLYGKEAKALSAGEFETQDSEHQFLCRSADVEGQTRGAEIEYLGRSFSINHSDFNEPAVMLYGE